MRRCWIRREPQTRGVAPGPKIAVLGEAYSPNLGDAVIADVIRHIIQTEFPDAFVSVRDLSGRNTFGSIPTRSNRFGALPLRGLRSAASTIRGRIASLGRSKDGNRAAFASWLRAWQLSRTFVSGKPDLCVYAGGQLIMSYFAQVLVVSARRWERDRIPIIFNAVGVGPMGCAQHRRWLARALNSRATVAISSRDDIGAIKLLRGRSFPEVIPRSDPALLARIVDGAGSERGDIVGLGVISQGPSFNEALFVLVKGLVSGLQETGRDWRLFMNGKIADQDLALDFASRLGVEDTMVMTRPTRPRELVELVSSFGSMVACRLHSHIIGAAMGVPSVGISWDPKVDQFFSSIGVPHRSMSVDQPAAVVLAALGEAELHRHNRELIDSQAALSWKDLAADVGDALGLEPRRVPVQALLRGCR